MHSYSPSGISEYRLWLDVHVDEGSWHGRVEFDPGPTPRTLILDADGLDVRTVSEDLRPLPFVSDPEAGQLSFPVQGGVGGTVVVEFSGRVRPGELIGFYRCRQGEGSLLTTQCEPRGACRIFPCVDRPDHKARIRLTVRVPAGLEVISNTPELSAATLEGGVVEHAFEATPPMATYLFYLGIGRFDRTEDRTGRVAVRVLTPPGRGFAGAYGAESARRILDGFEAYFRVPYPLPKLDLVAVADHAFGAMENWGAISFRDVRLLVDPNAESFARRDVFETVAHEIAHQWFGNLVTMRTWDDVWLNESFASLMETRLSERLIPELDPLTDFFLRVAGTLAALEGDALPSTHPVRTHVARPEEISQIFDEISYGKGCSVLAMLEGYLGPDRFREGVVAYLEKFRYANARTEDLWDALGSASGEPVGAIATPWIERPGHPVVDAELEGSRLRLTQRRYALLPGGADEPPWPIPLVLDVDGRRLRVFFDGPTTEVVVPQDATVHLNPGAVGFYRSRYSRGMFERLLKTLSARSPTDRWTVANDYASFLASGTASWADYVRLVRALGTSDELLVVDTVAGSLLSLARTFPEVPSVQDETRRYLAARLASVGLRKRAGEPLAHGILRERLASARVRADPGFARELSELYAEWPRLDPDLRPAVAVARARTDGRAAWNALRGALGSAGTEVESIVLDRALGWASEPDLVTATLDLTLTGAIVRGHATSVLVQAATNPIGAKVVWPWLQEHLGQLAEGFRGSGQLSLLLERTLPLVGAGREGELRAYFRDHPFPEGSRGLRKGFDRLEVVARLRERSDEFDLGGQRAQGGGF